LIFIKVGEISKKVDIDLSVQPIQFIFSEIKRNIEMDST